MSQNWRGGGTPLQLNCDALSHSSIYCSLFTQHDYDLLVTSPNALAALVTEDSLVSFKQVQVTNISHTYWTVRREYPKMVNKKKWKIIMSQVLRKKGNFQCLISWHSFHEAQCYSANLHLGTFRRARYCSDFY